MQINVVTLFPEMLEAVTEYGITARAVKQGLVQINSTNPRDFTVDRHRTVDDRPYGGGPGMVMKVAPLRAAIESARQSLAAPARVIYLSPQGRRLDQAGVRQLSAEQHLVLVAGRYEGIDERVIAMEVDEEWSIGDYVLSGGELAAMVLIDALVRQVPGALGHEQSAQQDSFAEGLLDCPHFTRPEQLEGRQVPDVLLSGDHENIRRWRLKQALGRTWQRRPDLLVGRSLSGEEETLLSEFIAEHQAAADSET